MSKNIFVFVEQRGGSIQKVSLELIGEATRLAADLGEAVVAVLMGHNIADKADMLCQYGADEVLVLDHPVRPTLCCSAPAPSAAIWHPALPDASTPA